MRVRSQRILLLLALLAVGIGVIVFLKVQSPDNPNTTLTNVYEGPDIFFFPNTPDDFRELFSNEKSWESTRQTIHAWCAPIWWWADPDEAHQKFLRTVMLPALKRWNIKRCIESGPGAGWDESNGKPYRATDSLAAEAEWWAQVERLFGTEHPLDYLRLDSPNYYGLKSPPDGAGFTLQELLQENLRYITALTKRFNNPKVIWIDATYGQSEFPQHYVDDVMAWLAAVRTVPELTIYQVDFEIPYDPVTRTSHADVIAQAQQYLRSQGVRVGTWFIDGTYEEWNSPDVSVKQNAEKKWYEEQIMNLQIKPYQKTGFVSDAFTVGSYGPGPRMLPESSPFTMTKLVLEVADIFGK